MVNDQKAEQHDREYERKDERAAVPGAVVQPFAEVKDGREQPRVRPDGDLLRKAENAPRGRLPRLRRIQFRPFALVRVRERVQHLIGAQQRKRIDQDPEQPMVDVP